MLVKQWLKLHKTKASALRELNKALGSNYTSNRLYDWINGKHRMPKKVEIYMRNIVTDYILDDKSMDGRKIRALLRLRLRDLY